MARDFLTDSTSIVLRKTLDTTVARQRAIANNIANVETPGYKRVYVPFEDELRGILQRKDETDVRQRLNKLAPVQQTDEYSPSKPDGNNVNIDAEMADLAKNQLVNKAAMTLLQAKSAIIRAAISEGKR